MQIYMVPTNQGPLKSDPFQIILERIQLRENNSPVQKNSRSLLVCGGPERCSTLPKVTELLRDLVRLLISCLLCQAVPQWRVYVAPTVLLPTPARGQRCWMGRKRAKGSRQDWWRMSPVLFAFKAKREAMAGDKAAESSGEVSGGLVASR